jgi:RNA 3'-terminal phosphate cyclase (ATP)
MSQAHVAETAAEAEFIEIDGSKGEGGGQIFRLSIGLSAVTGQPVLNHSVRANRPKPGLALQHLACVRAVQVPKLLYSVVDAHDVQMLCKASVHGAALKSPRVAFTPTTIIDGGDYRL